jgi:hypothetical protein
MGAEDPEIVPLSIRLHANEVKAIDSYRRSYESPPSRAAAAALLVRIALAQRESGSPVQVR